MQSEVRVGAMSERSEAVDERRVLCEGVVPKSVGRLVVCLSA